MRFALGRRGIGRAAAADRAARLRRIAVWLCVLALGGFLPGPLSWATPGGEVHLLELKGAVGPAVSDYIHRGFEKARKRGASLIILRIDTPGGLDTAMRDIIRDILGSPIPVVSFIAPSGARAASAGTYIAYASHVAAMAPGTNLGAATPVQIGGSFPGLPGGGKDKQKQGDREEAKKPEVKPKATMSDKLVNDAVAYIRSLAQLRGRNADWAEKAVREAASLSAADAVEQKVVDLIANDVPDLLKKLDGREVEVLGAKQTLGTAGAVVKVVEPDWRSKLLAVITNPNIAYILMLIGIYGLILEFYSPGVLVPGVVGAISLLLALYAFQLLPINYAGLALMLFGLGLMVAEAFAPSFGILGLGGAAAFVIGSVMLLETDVPGFRISWMLIGSIALVSAGCFVLMMTLLMRARRRPVVTGQEQMIGGSGRVLDWDGRSGRVRLHGEIWQATAPESLDPGSRVRVEKIDGLTLVVRPDNEGGNVP